MQESFDLRVVRSDDPDSCWGWVGSKTGKGYAQCPPYGKAYRWVLEQKLGRTLLPGEQCRHLCGNSLCTNPLHLTVGSNADNSRDKTLHHGGKYGSSSRYKLTLSEAEEIRTMADTTPPAEIAQLYGITTAMVRKIITKRSWNVNH